MSMGVSNISLCTLIRVLLECKEPSKLRRVTMDKNSYNIYSDNGGTRNEK